MQTSKGASQQSKEQNGQRGVWRRRLAVLIVVALLVALANALLTYVLVPYGSKSELAWQDFAAQSDVDCVAVGTSTIMRSIDPAVLDAQLGTHSFVLATPSQLLEESYVAVKTAYEERGISRVILGLSYSQLMRTGVCNPGSPFMYERSRVTSWGEHLDAVSYMLFECGALGEPSSLNMLFPWASSMVSKSLDGIVKNAAMKADGTTLYDAAAVNEPSIHYYGRGFSTNNKVLNYSGDKAQSFFATERRDDVGVDTGNVGTVNALREHALDDLCTYCREHGIELVAVGPPLAIYNILEYGDEYFTMNQRLTQFFAERGAHYYDINLARPELYKSEERYFSDPEHTNLEGAQVFTASVAKLLRAVDAGEATDGLFMGKDEYLHSIKTISSVFVDATTEEDGVHLRAHAWTGPDVSVEYCYYVKKDDSWQVVRDWSKDDAFVYLPPDGARGRVELRVEARRVGVVGDYDRSRELMVLY